MLKKISSTTNSLIIECAKLSNAKHRKKTGLFAVEGEKALEDIISAKIEIEHIFVSEDFSDICKLPQNKLIVASEPVMKKLATSDSTPKVITVAHQRAENLSDFKNFSKILLSDGISDPGNMGTIIRSASAFGYEGILLTENCVDIYNPKIIRSAAGNFFKIQFANVDFEQLKQNFSDFQFIMTDLHGKKVSAPEEIQLKQKHILVLGSEANGISDNILKIPHENVKIQTKNVESLNVAISASILMYEFSK